MTGRSNSAATSRMIWILSASSARRWVRVLSLIRMCYVRGLRIPNLIMLKSIGLLVIVSFAAFAQGSGPSGERIREHTRFLSSDLLEGRGVGTRGGDLATEYIAN